MNESVLKNAIGSLEVLLGRAKDALWNIERNAFGDPGYGELGSYEHPESALASFLQETYAVLLVILEAAGMPETRASLIAAWQKFEADQGLLHTIDDPDLQNCESPALTFLERVIEGLRSQRE